MDKKSFFNRKSVGLVLRTFAPKQEQIPERINQIKNMVAVAGSFTFNGIKFFKRIDVIVWNDKNYSDTDCGLTTEEIKKELVLEKNVHVHEFNHGDIFCGALNFGVAIQSRNGIDYTAVASTEALTYLTEDNLLAMVEALCEGALATGVAINELSDSIMAGRLANTLAIWHNISLLSVGGFDLRAAKPKNEKDAFYLKGWSEQKKSEVYYQLGGVEEVIPLARMVETFGPCIVPILSQDGQYYIVPNAEKEPELYNRHVSKMGTKLERQTAFLAQIGYDPSYLKGGILKK